MRHTMEKVEYRVRPVTRYIVTRYESTENSAGCDPLGEFDNADTAQAVGYALCRAEHERLGWPLDDDRIQYPRHPNETNALRSGSLGRPFLCP